MRQKRKTSYTTGDIAKLVGVAPRTVTKWFDNGTLQGYRIPDSKDRRIPHDKLLDFLTKHNMPVPIFTEKKEQDDADEPS